VRSRVFVLILAAHVLGCVVVDSERASKRVEKEKKAVLLPFL
jgi:hypothetical protein